MRQLRKNANFRRITAFFWSQAWRAHKQACFEVIQRVSRLKALSKRKKILNFVDDMEADVAKLRYVITKPISVVFYSV